VIPEYYNIIILLSKPLENNNIKENKYKRVTKISKIFVGRDITKRILVSIN
jgi:hypothetical protein